jgi:hypothetical protein
MQTTQPIPSKASGPQTLRELDAEISPVIGAVYVAGPPVFVAWLGTVLFALMLAGPFALLVTLVVAFVVAATLVTLTGAILATPYLLIRHVRKGHVSEAWAPIAKIVARVRKAAKRPRIAALPHSMTARASR